MAKYLGIQAIRLYARRGVTARHMLGACSTATMGFCCANFR